MVKIKLDPDAIKYLCYQRTQYCEQVARLYTDELLKTYENIGAYLPSAAHRILDVGAGLAGIDAFLYQHYASPDIVLLDRNGIEDKSKIGYHKSAESFGAYNSFAAAEKLLIDAGVSPNRITLHNIEFRPFPAGPFDLILSLLSWGFHYPLATYAAAAMAALSPQGKIIVDVRKGEDDKSLGKGRVIHTAEKFERKVFTKC